MGPSKRFHFWKTGRSGDSKAEGGKAHTEHNVVLPHRSDTLCENSQDQPIEGAKSKSSPEDDPTRFGLKVLVPQPAGKERCVDIIAIHGLNGHYEATWTDRTTGANWLKDPEFLRKDIPNARIQSFGYNSV